MQVKGIMAKLAVAAFLVATTVTAYGACFSGWFLPKPLDKPVSLREGSARTGGYHYYPFFLGTGRTHYGGGYRGGK